MRGRLQKLRSSCFLLQRRLQDVLGNGGRAPYLVPDQKKYTEEDVNKAVPELSMVVQQVVTLLEEVDYHSESGSEQALPETSAESVPEAPAAVKAKTVAVQKPVAKGQTFLC